MMFLFIDWCAYNHNSSRNDKFILKDFPTHHFEYVRELYRRAHNSPYIRVAEDAAPDHLLDFTANDVPLLTRKKILENALRGLAALHEQIIVHTGNSSFGCVSQ